MKPWFFRFRLETAYHVKELAALNQLTMAQTVTRLIWLAMKDGYEFPPIPPGTRLLLKGQRGKTTAHSIPKELADYLDSLMTIGYSRHMIGEWLVTRGMEIVKSRKNPYEGALRDNWQTGEAADSRRDEEVARQLRSRAVESLLPKPPEDAPEVRGDGPAVLQRVSDPNGSDDMGAGAVEPEPVSESDRERDPVGFDAASGAALVELAGLDGDGSTPRKVAAGAGGQPKRDRALKDDVAVVRHEGCGGVVTQDIDGKCWYDDDGLHFPLKCECGAVLRSAPEETENAVNR